jgi:proteic killer suppression protein
MLYRHADKDLQRLEADPAFNAGYSRDIVKAFRKRMQQIRVASNENDLRSVRSLNFEKLKGKRQHEYSIRINDQFRLIFQIKTAEQGNQLVLTGIEDYHP